MIKLVKLMKWRFFIIVVVLIGIGISIVVDATSNSCKRDGEDGANVIWYWRKGYVSLLWLQLIYIWLLFEPFL